MDDASRPAIQRAPGDVYTPQRGETPFELPEMLTRLLVRCRFGRIGQMVVRAAQNNPDIEIVAVNDPFTDLEYAVSDLVCFT